MRDRYRPATVGEIVRRSTAIYAATTDTAVHGNFRAGGSDTKVLPLARVSERPIGW